MDPLAGKVRVSFEQERYLVVESRPRGRRGEPAHGQGQADPGGRVWFHGQLLPVGRCRRDGFPADQEAVGRVKRGHVRVGQLPARRSIPGRTG